MKIIVNTCMAIIATASIIFVSTEAAASSPYQRKLSKKDKEHHNSANCPNSLYFSSGEFLTNIQYFIGPEQGELIIISRNETKRNETKRNETKRNETKRNETK
jgi:hypothetical protein